MGPLLFVDCGGMRSTATNISAGVESTNMHMRMVMLGRRVLGHNDTCIEGMISAVGIHAKSSVGIHPFFQISDITVTINWYSSFPLMEIHNIRL